MELRQRRPLLTRSGGPPGASSYTPGAPVLTSSHPASARTPWEPTQLSMSRNSPRPGEDPSSCATTSFAITATGLPRYKCALPTFPPRWITNGDQRLLRLLPHRRRTQTCELTFVRVLGTLSASDLSLCYDRYGLAPDPLVALYVNIKRPALCGTTPHVVLWPLPGYDWAFLTFFTFHGRPHAFVGKSYSLWSSPWWISGVRHK